MRTMRVARGLLLALLVVACAKQPATTQATAPAPGGTPGSPSTGSVRPAAGTPERPARSAARSEVTPTATARPAPQEFVAVADLRDVHFDFDKAEIRPEDAKILVANAAWLKAHPDYLVLVEGHCDERGTGTYNLALGERRAKASTDHLVAQGVAAARISVVSYGQERPACTEHNEACWTKNRRAHFLVKPR